jgi:hypothetical protein
LGIFGDIQLQETIMEQQMNKPQTDDRIHKWGALASFCLAVTFIVPGLIYLVGDLRTAIGPYAYRLADFLYGPVWSACSITVIIILREQLDKYTPRRMTVAMFTAFLSAAAMIAVAFIRASNRQYHLLHPELHLEDSIPVLVVWATLVTGLTSAGWHFLGWTQIMVGSAGWASQRLPRLLSMLYLLAGVVSLFVYLIPFNEGLGILLGFIIAIWQGVLFWVTKSND